MAEKKIRLLIPIVRGLGGGPARLLYHVSVRKAMTIQKAQKPARPFGRVARA
jgi:hypothetical protein